MKLSDYVADFLAKKGIKKTFGITGGVIIHVFDSIGKHPDIDNICTQHEQGASIAADAYSRVNNNFGVSIATSGPGAMNLITGVGCSYFDSIPCMVITGQAPLSQLRGNSKSRQVGFQETDIVSMFKPITKYAVMVRDHKKIRYELEKAFYLANSDRPGPVLIDLPDDIQREEINPEELESFTPPIKEKNIEKIEQQINETINLINNSERPLLILGNGIKLANMKERMKNLVEILNLPVVLTWATLDFFQHNHPLSVRDFGVTANRPGNFAVQNADLIIAIGTRLDTHETGSDLSTFAREAKRVVIDIDNSELEKYEERGLPIDIKINSDVKDFIDVLEKNISLVQRNDLSNWKDKIKSWKEKYPICLPEYSNQEPINPYVFLDVLSDEAKEDDIIIPETGCNVAWGMQGWKVKSGQNLFTSYNNSPMGYGLPAAIGASLANNNKRVICIIGDGGLQMNIQELATAKKHNLPLKLFIMNNDGYGMIKQTQEMWLNSRFFGSAFESGLQKVDLIKIAQAYDIKTITIQTHEELKEKIKQVLDSDEPILCDVKINSNARIYPKLTFGKPIEDSSPLLSREEFNKEMIAKPLEEANEESSDSEKSEITNQSSKEKSTINISNIDNPKVAYHPERTKEWLERGDCYPLYVEIGPTDACNHKCVFCALDYMNCTGKIIDTEVMLNALEDMAKKGVKSIMFGGEGEPFLHKDICLFTNKAKEYGLDVSFTTNGTFFDKPKIEQCLKDISWIKFSIDAGTSKDYAEIHGTSEEDFEKLMTNLKDAVEHRKKHNLSTTIGAQCLIIPKAIENIEKLAQRLKEIGLDYLILKPYSKHPQSINEFVINPEEYNLLEDKLKKYNSDNFKILFRKSTIQRMDTERDYHECHGTAFMALIDAQGNIIPCNLFYNNPEFTYGNLNEQKFSEIWTGEKRKQVLQRLKEKGISECRNGCRLDPSNRFLHRLKNPHLHDNFI
jgi:acetolactate synthase I/II/III large subunit